MDLSLISFVPLGCNNLVCILIIVCLTGCASELLTCVLQLFRSLNSLTGEDSNSGSEASFSDANVETGAKKKKPRVSRRTGNLSKSDLWLLFLQFISVLFLLVCPKLRIMDGI